jgi:hypothetical protein
MVFSGFNWFCCTGLGRKFTSPCSHGDARFFGGRSGAEGAWMNLVASPAKENGVHYRTDAASMASGGTGRIDLYQTTACPRGAMTGGR